MKMYNNLSDDDAAGLNYLHYSCKGANIVCEGTSKEDAQGNPTDWQIIPTRICNDKAANRPDFPKPNCAQGRSLPSQSKDATAPKKSKVLMWAGIGFGALAVIVIAGVVIKNRKK